MPKGSSGKNDYNAGGAKSPLGKPEPTEYFNTKSRSGGGGWKRDNFDADVVDAKAGIIKLNSPKDVEYDNVNKNTTHAKGIINHGYVSTSNSGSGDFVGVNWANVKEVQGNTFAVRGKLKDLGFKFDPDTKTWKKD